MRKIVFLFFLINFSLFAQQETKKNNVNSNNSLVEKENSFSINTIESIPLAPGCENVTKSEQMSCFVQFLNLHIKKHFQYPEEAYNKRIQGRVYIEITINEEGVVDKIRTRGPNKILEDECKRIVSLLPKFTPGFQDEKPVNVKYTFPIGFKVK